MRWNTFTQPSELGTILVASQSRPQVVLKHSTRCSISDMAKSRLERQQKQQPLEADFHLLLVIESRPASNHVTEQLQVPHESPQLLLIHKGEVVLDQSHYDIQLEELVEVLAR